MKESLNAIRVALFFIVGLVLVYVVYATLGNKDFREEDGYHVTATFEDMGTLSPDDDVRMAGVRIGRVQETNLVQGKGQAVLLIDRKYADVPADSVATVAMANLLGKNFVSITYGNPNAGMLQDGAELQTEPAVTVGAVLKKVDTAVGQISGIGEGSGNLFNKLETLVDENSTKLNTTLDNLQAITQDLRDGKGTIGKLLQSDEAHEELLATMREIHSAATDARDTLKGAQDMIAQVESGQGTVGKLLYSDDIANKIDATVSNLQAFSEQLKSGDGTLGKLVNDDQLYNELRALISQAEQSLNAMSDSGPVSAVGAAAGGLF